MYKLNENEPDKVKRYRESLDNNALYTPSDNVTRYQTQLQEHEQNRVQPWSGGTYQESLQQAMDKINNREKFSYDLNGDALYQQYKDKYMTQGRTAMMDTIGQASALTGGYGNSYAATVGNQAYQGYLSQLNDIVPQLYQMALERYESEGQDLYNQYNMYNDQYNNEYGRYRDTVGDWNTEAARLADMYYNEYDNDYRQYGDAWDRSYQLYQLALAEQEALLGGGGSGGGSGGSGYGGSGSGDIGWAQPQTAVDYIYNTKGANAAYDALIKSGATKAQATASLKNAAVEAMNNRGTQAVSKETAKKQAKNSVKNSAAESIWKRLG